VDNGRTLPQAHLITNARIQSNPTTTPETVTAEIDRIAPRLTAFRRHLHQYPELSGAEFATTSFLAKQLAAANIPFRLGAGKRGIITALAPATSARAPVIVLRADIDALPITEENQVSYRSQNKGVMHACGHDAHSAILLGTTLALQRAGPLPVAWRSIFQPSEETGCGASEMVALGAVQGAQAIVAFHVDPSLPVGRVSITPGPQSAFCQDFTIEVRGRGGHGARPHKTIDPIAAAAHHLDLSGCSAPDRRPESNCGDHWHDSRRTGEQYNSGYGDDERNHPVVRPIRVGAGPSDDRPAMCGDRPRLPGHCHCRF
jgi:hypothetical protein